ncbi:2-methylaconitate cis-trans isomerase PrpF family protein [Humitalea sp. 24SJ18S-53]|uniref:2-methylaconitate cis-trans isomerase PrpF family protein n=1 Tax=Humitalea sp. 24SJ18S-53 TaxID=3422307 RepID=UPI003D66B680
MRQRRIPAVFMRGGTSRAVMFKRSDLPADRAEWDPIFLAALGSPDPNGRQLDGMGGGVSSLSKVCVIGPPSRSDADVDYTFAQVSVREALVDYSGSCGNMSSAIGPFALDEGMVPAIDGEVAVRIHDTNAGRIIVSRFAAEGGEALVDGSMTLDGVGGSGAPIRLEFMDPGGARTGALLPTGRARDWLEGEAFGRIEASIVDAASPGVFIRAADVGMTGAELPQALDDDIALHARLEAIRCAAAVAMGLAKDPIAARRRPAMPRIAMVAPPREATLLSGRILGTSAVDLNVRMLSMGQAHRAVPATGALCLGVASRIPGSLVAEAAGTPVGSIRIGHASGVTVADAVVEPDGNGWVCRQAVLYRTARRLFEGAVLVRGR